MVPQNLSSVVFDWQQQAYQFLIQENYLQAARLYEQAIAAEPSIKTNYWYLGLVLLLQGQEVEAQTTWWLGMTEEGELGIEPNTTDELIEILQVEAERRRERGDCQTAWVIRQHIREINPNNINNLLHLVGLSTLLETYTGEELENLGIINLLKSETASNVDFELLMQVLKNVLNQDFLHPKSLELTDSCLPHIKNNSIFLAILIPFIYQIAYSDKQVRLATKFAELGLRLVPNEPELLRTLAAFYQDLAEFEKGIEMAKQCYFASTRVVDRIYANLLIMRGLMSAGGYWQEFCQAFDHQKDLIEELLREQPTNLDSSSTIRLLNSLFFSPYFQDQPDRNNTIRSQVTKVAQLNIENYAKELVNKCRQRHSPLLKQKSVERRLKIGYLSHCLRSHSVGWLARGVFQHYDRDRFEVYAYLLASDSELNSDPLEKWYITQVKKAEKLNLSGWEAAEKISSDGIDILIDLDSLTLTTTCEVMAIKPSPVQATWLGWDASGIPTVDYFIADPYVLPECAQDYYTERIWRLPHTYIAVDGFEVGIPTLRRDQLDIPSDAIIYYSGQRGYKYHPEAVRLQMQIIKSVPNSYFLFKGYADRASLKNFLIEIAESEGVAADRLRFLPLAPSELVHRANLAIADIVLDTYPYNGATTTMETLWMGIPLVTRVGQQFSARNSYTMMINAGVTEGIAWTDEEYVEWGIRLGRDTSLRQQITWKLEQSRRTSPLWNAKQFTREMEKAYEQMWVKYMAGNN